jgi:hypothetical protein
VTISCLSNNALHSSVSIPSEIFSISVFVKLYTYKVTTPKLANHNFLNGPSFIGWTDVCIVSKSRHLELVEKRPLFSTKTGIPGSI